MTENYLPRHAEQQIDRSAKHFPAVGIVGPRQVGKTSLAKKLAATWAKPSIYLDLENPADLHKLSDPLLFLDPLREMTVILDEVQRVPSLFPILRGLIDSHRVAGRFILLGSASPDLIRDASETLAGRIVYHELSPLTRAETASPTDFRTHWLRGGFPDSLLAMDNELSLIWRENFIRTYLERDLPMLGLNASPLLTRRLWTMLAHLNGGMPNLESLGNSLDVSATTARRYVDFFEASYLIRRIQPWFSNISKRLVKTPKSYLRDTGILHALLAIGSSEQLLGHPAIGASWEAYVINELAAILPSSHELFFYRTQDGTEADIVVVKAGKPDVLVEIKHSSTPNITKSLTIAAQDLATRRSVIVSPVPESYPLRTDVQVLSIFELEQIFDG